MFDYYFIFQSVSAGQRAANSLKQRGIQVVLQKAPKKLSGNGCGYAIQVPQVQYYSVLSVFQANGIAFEKLYRFRSSTCAEEVLP